MSDSIGACKHDYASKQEISNGPWVARQKATPQLFSIVCWPFTERQTQKPQELFQKIVSQFRTTSLLSLLFYRNQKQWSSTYICFATDNYDEHRFSGKGKKRVLDALVSHFPAETRPPHRKALMDIQQRHEYGPLLISVVVDNTHTWSWYCAHHPSWQCAITTDMPAQSWLSRHKTKRNFVGCVYTVLFHHFWVLGMQNLQSMFLLSSTANV